MPAVTPVRMPKWGLSMEEGTIVDWLRPEGAVIAEGDDLVDIETAKISNVFESPASGVLRRIVAQPGDVLPVGALIGVIAEAEAPDAEVEAFIDAFRSSFVPETAEDGAGSGLALRSVEVGGRRIEVGRTGQAEGVPVVLVHGFSGDMNGWLFNIDALSAVAPVIAVDLPGHGASSKDVGDGSLETLSAAVGGALDALGVDRAHLVGHSLGASVVARLAADRPGLAASVVLICPAGLGATPVSEAFLTGVVDADRAKDLKPVLEMLVADPAMVSKDMVETVLRYKRLDGVDEALARLRDHMLDGSDFARLRADLARIPSALVIASDGDQIVGVPDPAVLPSGFHIERIAGAGHLPHLEAAGAVNALLLAAVG